MEFRIKTSYRLDLLNLLNVLTGKRLYRDRHSAAFEHFSPLLSPRSRRAVETAVEIHGSAMLSPHGSRISGPRFINDARYSDRILLGTAIHEMFHPPYDHHTATDLIARLAVDPLVRESFARRNPAFGYPAVEGFIEENVVDAMAIFVCSHLNLVDDPLAYFAAHDEGSHKLSVVLFEAFGAHPKDPTESFEAYFRYLLDKLPVGNLDAEYARSIASSGPTDDPPA